MNRLIRMDYFIFYPGQTVRIVNKGFGDTNLVEIEGYVGEILDGSVYIWQNHRSGSCGRINPQTAGYRYSYQVNICNDRWVEELSDKGKALIEHEFNSNEVL